jgi:hypothetical protein
MTKLAHTSTFLRLLKEEFRESFRI